MDQILKILIIDQDANHADHIVRTIKSLCYAVRETIVSSKEQFDEIQQLEVNPNLIIQASNINELSISDSRNFFATEPHDTPIIALCDDITTQLSLLLGEGANIVIPYNDNELLQQVTSRIAQTEFYIQDLKVRADSYKELDELYNKILDTSRDAICYIHEACILMRMRLVWNYLKSTMPKMPAYYLFLNWLPLMIRQH